MHPSSSKPTRSGLDAHFVIVVVSGVLVLSGFVARRADADATADILYVIGMLVAASDILVGTLKRLVRGVLDVDLLMLLAAGGATLMGEVGEAAVLLFLFALGHALEHLAMRRAIREGAGIGFMSRLQAAEIGGLIEVTEPREEWSAPLWLVTHMDLHRTTKVQSFLAFLKDRARAWEDL